MEKDDPNKLRELEEKYLRIYEAVLGRAPKVPLSHQ